MTASFEFAQFPSGKDYNFITSKSGVIKRVQAFDASGMLVAELSDNKMLDEVVTLFPQPDGSAVRVYQQGYRAGAGHTRQEWRDEKNQILGSVKKVGDAVIVRGHVPQLTL